jgi:hypothetical protein
MYVLEKKEDRKRILTTLLRKGSAQDIRLQYLICLMLKFTRMKERIRGRPALDCTSSSMGRASNQIVTSYAKDDLTQSATKTNPPDDRQGKPTEWVEKKGRSLLNAKNGYHFKELFAVLCMEGR